MTPYPKTILVTGAAGFIGMHVSRLLLEQGHDVWGIDDLNDYYDVSLKNSRLEELMKYPRFKFKKVNITNPQDIKQIFTDAKPEFVIHLAAQAGVRYSLINPQAYIQSNMVGFGNILEECRHHAVKHLVYASSSSVYGSNSKLPFSVTDSVDHPVSLYAASKKANELMAHSYSHLYNLPTTGLRYFTVYGPWGRPDMSPWIFTESILSKKPINIFNNGQMKRDFTFINDIAEGTIKVLGHIPSAQSVNSSKPLTPGRSTAPFRIYNIGNHQPVDLMVFIEILERTLNKKAIKNFLPMQPGDVVATFADIEDLAHDIGFTPQTTLEQGIDHWVRWYKTYKKIA